MHHPQTKHTIDIFKHMAHDLPPLLPDVVKKEVEHALEHLENDYTIGIEEVEDVVIGLGKKVWPYWKAFDEMFVFHQGQMGEKFLEGKMPLELKKKYKLFKEHGGDYHDLRVGGPAVFFEPEERQKLAEILVDVDNELRQYVKQSVLSGERKKYENLIIELQGVLDDVEKRLGHLRTVAEDEEEHPQLASEIRAQVRAFEFGLCLLGPRTKIHEVENAKEYFEGRKVERRMFGY
jgi:hypothetical protein